MLFLRRGPEVISIGRVRRYERGEARELLDHVAATKEGKRHLREVLTSALSSAAIAGLSDEEVRDDLASRIARGELVLIPHRPLEAKIAPPHGEDAAPSPTEAVPPPAEEKKADDWLEILLVDESDPPEPIAGAAYRVELDDGRVLEGYLNEMGKARVEGIRKGNAKVSFPELDEEAWMPA